MQLNKSMTTLIYQVKEASEAQDPRLIHLSGSRLEVERLILLKIVTIVMGGQCQPVPTCYPRALRPISIPLENSPGLEGYNGSGPHRVFENWGSHTSSYLLKRIHLCTTRNN